MLEKIRIELMKNQDLAYRDFMKGLIPSLGKEPIGVRTPILRKLAKEIFKGSYGPYQDFLEDLPHQYHEEDMVHAYILGFINTYDDFIVYLEDFLAYVDNWAVADSLGSKSLEENPSRTYEKILQWLESENQYTMRVALIFLIKYFTKDRFRLEINDLVAGLESKDYYVQMAQAWYFQKALVYHRDETLSYFESVLGGNVKRMAIQKAVDSNKISLRDKAYLKGLRD